LLLLLLPLLLLLLLLLLWLWHEWFLARLMRRMLLHQIRHLRIKSSRLLLLLLLHVLFNLLIELLRRRAIDRHRILNGGIGHECGRIRAKTGSAAAATARSHSGRDGITTRGRSLLAAASGRLLLLRSDGTSSSGNGSSLRAGIDESRHGGTEEQGKPDQATRPF
jgi:hypothetical protein